MQACLQIQFCTEHAHQRAEQGEAASHWQHIGHRQQEAAHAAGLAAQDHAGKDRQHWQHAGGECQAEAGEEEQRDRAPGEVAFAGLPAVGRSGGCACAIADGKRLGFRWIAQAFVGTTLVGDLQDEGAIVRVGQRKFDIDNAVVGFDLAEIVIDLGHTSGQLRLADGDRRLVGLEDESMPIEVVAFGSDEAQGDSLGRRFDEAQPECLAYRQEVAAIVQGAAEARAGFVVEQAGIGG